MCLTFRWDFYSTPKKIFCKEFWIFNDSSGFWLIKYWLLLFESILEVCLKVYEPRGVHIWLGWVEKKLELFSYPMRLIISKLSAFFNSKLILVFIGLSNNFYIFLLKYNSAIIPRSRFVQNHKKRKRRKKKK